MKRGRRQRNETRVRNIERNKETNEKETRNFCKKGMKEELREREQLTLVLVQKDSQNITLMVM